jgi:hypothetical protein
MWLTFHHFTRALSRKDCQKTARPSRVATFRPRLEALEERTLLSAYLVTTTADGGAGSLRDAVTQVNADTSYALYASPSNPNVDEIDFNITAASDTGGGYNPATGRATITLGGGELLLTNGVIINGPGTSLLAISGNAKSRVFEVAPAATATLSGVTVENGFSGADGGGGILNRGVLTVSNCLFSGNSAFEGGGIANFSGGVLTVSGGTFSANSAFNGGGIFNDGSLTTIGDSTFAGNVASNDGGGIQNFTGLWISGCTFSDNSAMNGGGIAVEAFSNSGLIANNSTFSGNNASNYGGGIAFGVENLNSGSDSGTLRDVTIAGNTASSGGGIWIGDRSFVRMSNTILAKNTADAGPDADGGEISSIGHNLIGDISGSIIGGRLGVADQVGTAANPIDPLLAPLGNYGGPTQTMALLPGSPALDAGDNLQALDVSRNPLTTDQRGFQRVVNGTVDIGAVEMQVNAATLPSAGAGAPIVTLQSPDGTTLTNVTALPPPLKQDIVVNGSKNVAFPVGVFGFNVQLPAGQQGASVDVILYMPAGTQVNAYYKQNPADGKWYEFNGATVVDRNGDGTLDVVLHLTDGGQGDTDGLDGVINDPGAPVFVTLLAQIDIKPGDSTNSVNLASQGMISVAILSTADFNAAWVDVNSVLFAGAKAVSFTWKDVNGDGRLDLVLNFRTQDTNLGKLYKQLLAEDINADGVLDSNQQEASIALTGQTTSDALFVGFDQTDLFLSGKALRQTLDQLAAAGAI